MLNVKSIKMCEKKEEKKKCIKTGHTGFKEMYFKFVGEFFCSCVATARDDCKSLLFPHNRNGKDSVASGLACSKKLERHISTCLNDCSFGRVKKKRGKKRGKKKLKNFAKTCFNLIYYFLLFHCVQTCPSVKCCAQALESFLSSSVPHLCKKKKKTNQLKTTTEN
ncbi:hypothetical protein RFI_05646 [Reticulomyxa filosa]|uniref:Uncharacterized protein n=1 Tax=Reticulomyxa filosa TaxID=46433 RepID=X6P074_RETFI|nr:hypothetical protein RFI_05646 [Reticulomyxa filosa]|eukprot:ETO31474.1 hypothetical protein RFI_05646 [Reticulomyxa filosa]